MSSLNAICVCVMCIYIKLHEVDMRHMYIQSTYARVKTDFNNTQGQVQLEFDKCKRSYVSTSTYVGV